MDDNERVDYTKDYYQALGVDEKASVEELKAAYVSLAMQYHPDTAPAGTSKDESSMKSRQAQFVQISEAYGVLSKASSKQQYDTSRSKFLGRNVGSVLLAATAQAEDHKVISESFNTQRINYAKIQSASPSNWKNLQEKYKSDKWRSIPLEQRKLTRAVPVRTVGGSLMTAVFPVVLTGIFIYGTFM